MKIVLDGDSLTIKELYKIAVEYAKVEISDNAFKRLESARKLIFELAEENVPVYGFNTGVGWNKDKHIGTTFFEDYNKNLINSHTLGVLPEASQSEVRATMCVRLNCLLKGNTGVQPLIAQRYVDFLNHHLHPVIPERGSVGVGDITTLSHIGQAMIGQGEVIYGNKRISAAEAHQLAGLKPVTLGPKDGLAIISSNALAMGQGALVLKDLQDMIDLADLIYAISLVGFNGNITPLDEKIHEIKNLPGQKISAALVRKFLAGSYLYEKNYPRQVQDPLSYRSGAYIHGSFRDSLDFALKYAFIQMNSSDDNPCLLPEERRIISCSNFEALSITLAFEMLAIALSHVSKMSCQRTIRISNPELTSLPRFLTPDETLTHAFGATQKVFVSLDTEIRHLANPSSLDYFPMAGSFEDHSNNFTFAVQKLRKMLDNLKYIMGIELMHACQAISLRLQKNSDLKIGSTILEIYNRYRQDVEFYDQDRPISPDIEKSYQLIKNGDILKIAHKAIEQIN